MRHSWLMTVIPHFRLQQVPFHHVLLFVSQLLGSREVTDYYRRNASCFASSADLRVLHNQASSRHCPQCNLDCLLFQNRLPKYHTSPQLVKRVSVERQMGSSAMSCNLHTLQNLSAINGVKYTGVVMHLYKYSGNFTK